MFNKKNKKKNKKPETFLDQVKLFFSTYLLALVIRTFIIEASQIPSQSMVPSLLVGDTLMVEKISLGTYIPVLNKKLPSFSQPEANNMVVFVSPEWKSPGFVDELITFLSLSLINKDNTFQNPKILVKRVAAGPGDVLTMTNKQVHFNGQLISGSLLATQNQVIYSGGKRQGRMSYNLFEEKTESFNRIIQHPTGGFEAESNSIEFYKDNNFELLLRSLVVQGFPPITIPKKGTTMIISNLNNYEKYLLRKLIQRESGIATMLRDGILYQNSQVLDSWTPRDDYYFMMGDNRDFSEDSRYFGYVPKQRIYGRVLFRYWPLPRFTFDANLKEKHVKK